MAKHPFAGKKHSKAVDDQYKMDLGKGIPSEHSYKKKVKPFQDAEDSTDEADTNEELEGECDTKGSVPSEESPTHHAAHGKMHQMMDQLEEPPIEGKVNPHHKASYHGHHPTSHHEKKKKLSMF